MIITSSSLANYPVLSLRSGQKIATISEIILNPYNLKVLAFRLAGRELDNPKDSFLLTEDIREFSSMGIIINDSEEIVASSDVIRLAKTLELNFNLVGLPVFDNRRRKVGKVTDFTLEIGQMLVYQLIVKRPFFKDFLDPELTIHRSQILEVSQTQITIKSSTNELRTLERQTAIDNFVNPFRQVKPSKEQPAK